MQKLFLAFLFLLLITQSCGLDDFMEEEAPLLNIQTLVSLELFGKKNEPLVLDFNQVLDFSQALSLKIKRSPQEGTLTFVEKSSFLIYQANNSVVSHDTFSYEVTYSNNQVVEGEVIVNLYDKNSNIGLDSCKIKAAYDYAEIPINTTLSINILENDVFCKDSIDISATFINITTQHGILILDNGQLTYTPDEGFLGYDELIYSSCTDKGDCASAILRILVREIPNCAFKLENDNYNVKLNNSSLDSATWLWKVFKNDSLCIDEVDWNTFKITKPTLYGDVLIVLSDSNKAVSFFPDYGFDGQDSFAYQVCDFNGECYDANVLINITNNIDFSAALHDDLFFTKTVQKQEYAILANDQLDKNTVDWSSFSIEDKPKNGTAKVEQDANGEYIISYTPNANFSNVDKLSYGLCLFSGDCFEAEVKIIVQPDNYICPTIAPFAKNDTIIFNNSVLEIPVLDNDDFCFAKVDWESFEIVNPPQYGSVKVNIAEDIIYVFNNDSIYTNISQDEFTYRWIQDGQSFEATVVMIPDGNKPFICSDIVDSDSLNNKDFDLRQLINAEIEEDKLYITIQYTGGCEFEKNSHYLLLEDEGTAQNTPYYELDYLFKNNDNCSYISHETRCFDLSIFKTKPNGGTAIIKLKGYGELVYEY